MLSEDLHSKIQSILERRANPKDLVPALQSSSSEVLYALISQTWSTGTTGAEYQAVRETAVAILQARWPENLIATMKQLNKSATILYWVGIAATVVIGVAQILVPLLFN